MASIQFNVPDELIPLVIEAFCSQYNYQAQVPDPANPGRFIANPQDQAAFTRQCFVNYGKAVVQAHQTHKAVEAARTQATQAISQTLDSADFSVVVVSTSGPQGPQGPQSK